MKIEQAMDQYARYLLVEKGLSRKTIEDYYDDFSIFLTDFPSVKDSDDLKEEMLEGFAIEEGEKSRSRSSIARRLSFLRGFFLFLSKQGLFDYSGEKIALPKPGGFNRDEVQGRFPLGINRPSGRDRVVEFKGGDIAFLHLPPIMEEGRPPIVDRNNVTGVLVG